LGDEIRHATGHFRKESVEETSYTLYAGALKDVTSADRKATSFGQNILHRGTFVCMGTGYMLSFLKECFHFDLIRKSISLIHFSCAVA
jgi:hypothetical protein